MAAKKKIEPNPELNAAKTAYPAGRIKRRGAAVLGKKRAKR